MYLTNIQLSQLGFKKVGENVLISDKASIYNAPNISIGSNVRIDDFALLSAGEGGIEIGNFVHIATGAKLLGKGKIVMEDFTGLSLHSILLSSSEPYDGTVLTNPTVDLVDRVVIAGDITIEKFSLIGACTLILPGVTMKENSSIGAMSMTKKDLDSDSVYVGIPAMKIRKREKPANINELMEKYGSRCT